jgi:hypothetical protein
MTSAVALYAAVVATASAGWQIYSFRHDRTVKVIVEMNVGGQVDASGEPLGEALVFITLTNHSAFPVRWTQSGIEFQDGSGQFAMVGLGNKVAVDFDPLPAVVQSRDSHRTAIEASKVAGWGFDLHRPLVAQAVLATGQVVRSRATTLFPK